MKQSIEVVITEHTDLAGRFKRPLIESKTLHEDWQALLIVITTTLETQKTNTETRNLI
jgi:hypothetical protein